jgi:carboxyl-terminal processing protease
LHPGIGLRASPGRRKRGIDPDSLKRPFKTTTAGWYDGGGIDPDIKTESQEAHMLSQVLFEKGFLFDYATQYVYKHPEPVNSRTFTLSDEEYQQFLNWMKNKNYSYKSYMEYQLQQLRRRQKRRSIILS